ncbi:MAG: hypothetical protein J5965_18220 [Aeriscardovia sp.]|nr:hypothetical protein [Aeriscardovia sp.]
MQLGFITLNTQERSISNRVLQAIRDQQAIDELGIGRLRDAFSNTIFPGMSTLQRHAKYFAVLPSLYCEVERGTYNRVQDVRRKVIELEVKMTRQMMNWAESGSDRDYITGITGHDAIDAAERDYTKYVKYDPSYIYWNGMVIYDMVKTSGNIYQILFERSKTRGPEKEEGDIGGLENVQLFSTSGEKYDFENAAELSMKLTAKEARFIRDKITCSKGSKDSMLAYMLKMKSPVCQEYDNLGTLMDSAFEQRYGKVYQLSVIFSHFVLVLRARLQMLFSSLKGQETNKEDTEHFKDVYGCYKNELTYENIERILDYFYDRVTERSLLVFCREASSLLEHEKFKELDELLINREKQVKGVKRSKLINHQRYTDFRFNTLGLTYRWELVYVMIKEIREGLGEWQEN